MCNPVTDRKKGCKECVWWDIDHRSGVGGGKSLNLSKAPCQYSPPTYGVVDSFFPETYGDSFCGKWTARPKEEV